MYLGQGSQKVMTVLVQMLLCCHKRNNNGIEKIYPHMTYSLKLTPFVLVNLSKNIFDIQNMINRFNTLKPGAFMKDANQKLPWYKVKETI